MRRAIVAAIVFLFLVAANRGFTQEHTPQPYMPDEFPSWAGDLWRAEAVLVGSFPLTLFTTLEVYDVYRYYDNDQKPEYAPWPFGAGAAVPYTAQETLWLAVSAISLSVVVSGIDFLLGRINERAATGP